jgi:putative ABC transport system permease protein
MYSDFNPALLVVQSSGSMGEFYGSRLPARLGEDLSRRGLPWAIPEIHTIIGSTPATAVLLRGIPLDTYSIVEEFSLIDGRVLLPGEPARSAMLGARLAERLSIASGDTIQLRGRNFLVVGVFSTGTYADHEAWISLSDAQALLNWGSDVSVYVIPAGEGLQPGDGLSDGASVVQKGNSSANLTREWAPLMALIEQVATVLGLAGCVVLANLLWRLAWQCRLELAILRSLGFPRRALGVYLLAQALSITLAGYLFGLVGAVGVSGLTETRTAGISLQPVFGADMILTSSLLALIIALAGSALPAIQLARLNLAGLLREE